MKRISVDEDEWYPAYDFDDCNNPERGVLVSDEEYRKLLRWQTATTELQEKLRVLYRVQFSRRP